MRKMKIRQISFRIGIAFITLFVGLSAVLIIRSWLSSQQCPTIAVEDSQKDNFLPISDEEYAVFSAVLNNTEFDKVMVISDHTSEYFLNDTPDINRNYFNLAEDTIRNYQDKNRELYRLENKFTFKNKYLMPEKIVLLSQEEEDILFPKGEAGWDKFYQKYPKTNGLIYFSSVGFNYSKDEALVGVAYQCHNCYNYGKYYSLKKISGKWIISRQRLGF